MTRPQALLALIITVAFLTLGPGLARAADDGATLYKTKCAACHGVDGAGKPTARIPSLIAEDAKNASDTGLSNSIANGGANRKPDHAFQTKGVTPDQIKMIVAYIREMQRK